MGRHIVRRLAAMIPVLFMISVLTFVVIQLPPGDFVDSYVKQQRAAQVKISPQEEASLRARYGVDEPLPTQYFRWMGGILHGDLGYSLALDQPVNEIVKSRLPYTVTIGVLSTLLLYAIAIPIGILSATRQYSKADYFFSVFGFLAMGVPDFILAVLFLWGFYKLTGDITVGLMDPQYVSEPFSLAKGANIISHLWFPALIAASTGTAATIRLLRANLLDELGKPYVTVALAKGVPRRRVIYKYPARMSMNPFIVSAAGLLAALVSGEVILSITLGLPTLAPIFLQSLKNQDSELAGSIVLILSALTVIGILLSDILLAVVDPRIRGSV